MEKTLQVQYNLIKEGKGDKAYFLKSAYRLFPDMLSQVNSFEDTTRILKNRGVISENIGGLVTTGKKQDWHAIFNENINTLKEEKEKEPSKEVLDLQKHAYDYKDEKNYDNLFGEEFLKGYYTEMKDPKNVDKDVEELRAIVAKNLAKDISYYVKNGQFGVKDLGYTTEAPGLGEPEEPKGKHASSGYGDIPKYTELKESVLRLAIQDLIKEALTEGVEKLLQVGQYGTYNNTPVKIEKVNSIKVYPFATYDIVTYDIYGNEDKKVTNVAIDKVISKEQEAKKPLSEELNKESIKEEGEKAKKDAMKKRIDREKIMRKKKIKALETLTELEEGEDNDNAKKIKELQSEIKQLEGMAAKLDGKKKKKEVDEFLNVAAGSNTQDVVNAAKAQGIKPQDAQTALKQANQSQKTVTLTGKTAS
jgi:hypothetical protein